MDTNKVEFAMMKREMIAAIESMEMGDSVILAITNGKKEPCTVCGKVHNGLRTIAKANNQFFVNVGTNLLTKAVEQKLGIDENNWGKKDDN